MTSPASDAGSTLWHGRFAEGPAEALMAYTASIGVRPPAVAGRHRRLAGPREGPRPRRPAHRSRAATRCSPRSTPSHARDGIGAFEFLPSDEDIHTAVERRVTELAGAAGRQAAHRPQPERPGRHRPAAVVQARAAARRRRASSICSGCCSTGPRPTRRRVPAGLHTPAARPASAARTSPSRPRLGAGPRRRPAARHRSTASTSRRSGPGRWRARRCRSTRRSPAAELGFARPFDNSLDAVSDRDFVAEALFDLALLGVHLARIGEEWVLWTSEEFGFARLDDALRHRVLDAAAEEEPRHRRARPGQVGSPHRQSHRTAGHAQGPAARVQPRPAGGQGAAVRLGRPGVAGARSRCRDDRDGDVRARTRWRRPPTQRRTPQRTSPSGWCARARHSATLTPSSARWSAST